MNMKFSIRCTNVNLTRSHEELHRFRIQFDFDDLVVSAARTQPPGTSVDVDAGRGLPDADVDNPLQVCERNPFSPVIHVNAQNVRSVALHEEWLVAGIRSRYAGMCSQCAMTASRAALTRMGRLGDVDMRAD